MPILKLFIILMLLFEAHANKEQEDKLAIQAERKWLKHIALVDEDVSLIKATKVKDISIYIRLLELYGEKLELYIERENYFLLNSNAEDYKNKVSQISNLKSNVFKELFTLSDLLLNKTKNPNVLAKVYYYRAENALLLKDKNKFYVNIKKSEALNKDEGLKGRINQRLSDYYFNEQKYENAARYYEELLKNSEDKWTPKYYYNLGWSYLKLNNFDKSLDSFKKSIVTSKMPGYFNIGEQAISSLMFAFVLSGNELSGYDYLESQDIINFKRGVSFLDYVFEHGDKKHAENILGKIEKYISSFEDLNQYIVSFLIIHRNLKKFKTLDEYISSLRQNEILLNSTGFTEEVVTNLRSYAGYLQELLRNKTYLDEDLRSALVIYAINTFEILSEFNKKRAIEYKFFQGEVYLSNERFQDALNTYKHAVRLMSDASQFKQADDYTEKVFQSLFTTLSKMDNPIGELRFTYDNYIRFGKNSILKIQVFQKYLAMLTSSEDGSFVRVLSDFSKKFPSNRESQISYYKLYVNELIKKDKPDLLLSLYTEVKGGLLKLENKEIDRLLEHFKNLILATVDNPKAQMSYDEKIKVLKDLEGKYKTKSVVVNELYYRYFKLSFEEKRIPDFLKFMAAYKVFTSSNKIIPDRKKMFSYVNIICDFDYDVECKAEIVYLSKLYKYSSLEPRLQERYFYILLKEGKLTSAYRVGLRISKLRKDFDYINPVSSLIMISDIGDVFKLVESKYALEKDRNIVLDLIEDHLIYRYSKDVNETKYIKKCIQLNPQKCQSLSKLASAYTQQAKFKMKLPPPFNNDEEVVFEKFGLELSNKMNTIQEETKKLEEFIKELDPRIQSLSFFIGIKYYEDLIRNFSLFIPKSEEVALVEAINGEMNNIKSIFAKKKEEYIISSKKIRSKVKDNSGASLLALPLKNRSDLSSEMGSLFLIRSEL